MAEHKKQERDFTSEVDVILPDITSLAQVSRALGLACFIVLTAVRSPANFRKPLTNYLL